MLPNRQPPSPRMNSTRIARGRRCALALALMIVAMLAHPTAAWAIDLSRIWPVAGSGAVVKELRKVGRFSSLRVNTDARVEVRQGEHESVEVEADDNVVPLIDAYVEDRVLVIEDNRHFKSSIARVIVTARLVEGIASTGDTAVRSEGLVTPTLSITVGGKSAVHLKSITAERVQADLGGSGALRISGSVNELSVALGGASALDAGALNARTVSVHGGGSSQALVWARDALSLALGGSAGVSYFGQPKMSAANAGSSTVRSLGDPPTK